MPENDNEDNHGQKRAHNSPSDADQRLPVTYRDIAPGKDREQFAVAPEVAPVVALDSSCFQDYPVRLHAADRRSGGLHIAFIHPTKVARSIVTRIKPTQATRA